MLDYAAVTVCAIVGSVAIVIDSMRAFVHGAFTICWNMQKAHALVLEH
jgi:hypothetical protein